MISFKDIKGEEYYTEYDEKGNEIYYCGKSDRF